MGDAAGAIAPGVRVLWTMMAHKVCLKVILCTLVCMSLSQEMDAGFDARLPNFDFMEAADEAAKSEAGDMPDDVAEAMRYSGDALKTIHPHKAHKKAHVGNKIPKVTRIPTKKASAKGAKKIAKAAKKSPAKVQQAKKAPKVLASVAIGAEPKVKTKKVSTKKSLTKPDNKTAQSVNKHKNATKKTVNKTPKKAAKHGGKKKKAAKYGGKKKAAKHGGKKKKAAKYGGKKKKAAKYEGKKKKAAKYGGKKKKAAKKNKAAKYG